jgi:hypothetical protein
MVEGLKVVKPSETLPSPEQVLLQTHGGVSN